MDGNQLVMYVLDLVNMPTCSLMLVNKGTSAVVLCYHPWTLDFGIPAEMTGILHLGNIQ